MINPSNTKERQDSKTRNQPEKEINTKENGDGASIYETCWGNRKDSMKKADSMITMSQLLKYGKSRTSRAFYHVFGVHLPSSQQGGEPRSTSSINLALYFYFPSITVFVPQGKIHEGELKNFPLFFKHSSERFINVVDHLRRTRKIGIPY